MQIFLLKKKNFYTKIKNPQENKFKKKFGEKYIKKNHLKKFG